MLDYAWFPASNNTNTEKVLKTLKQGSVHSVNSAFRVAFSIERLLEGSFVKNTSYAA
jgi:hypothetical protein